MWELLRLGASTDIEADANNRALMIILHQPRCVMTITHFNQISAARVRVFVHGAGFERAGIVDPAVNLEILVRVAEREIVHN